jgi:hypothetical protein
MLAADCFPSCELAGGRFMATRLRIGSGGWLRVQLGMLGMLAGQLACAGAVQAQDRVAEASSGTDADRGLAAAVRYLAREVPRWRVEEKCYSCHNNGDGARGLFAAAGAGILFDRTACDNTLAWLATPERWDSNGPQEPFNDKHLARLQFASALAAAVEAGLIRDRRPLIAAAGMLVQDQVADGSWEFVGADEIGSPVTFGRPLATALGVRVLRRADARRFAEPIAAADTWLRRAEPKSVLNAAAVLLGLADARDPAADRQRDQCLSLVRRGQASDGGWGPYVDSAPEPFDTALVLCALSETYPRGWADAIRQGREYLVRSQRDEGSWPETTRPAHRESYAQRLSTTGWATLALVATRNMAAREAE